MELHAVFEPDEGGWVRATIEELPGVITRGAQLKPGTGRVSQAKALGHSIFTQADTLEELRSAVQDAAHCHFDEAERPSLIRLHVVRDEVIPA